MRYNFGDSGWRLKSYTRRIWALKVARGPSRHVLVPPRGYGPIAASVSRMKCFSRFSAVNVHFSACQIIRTKDWAMLRRQAVRLNLRVLAAAREGFGVERQMTECRKLVRTVSRDLVASLAQEAGSASSI
jgi:hypothetical protein